MSRAARFDPPSSSGRIARGELLDDRYRIGKPLAIGGMSWLYEAMNERIGNPVAIKVLAPELQSSKEAAGRFLREAKALMQLRSENVVRVFDVGTTPQGRPYMAMEL